MTLAVGTNSYVTLIEANSYYADRHGYTKTMTEPALISAAQQLDLLCEWYGWPVSDSQAMAFPRNPDANPVPQAVKDAQCEIAYLIIDTDSTTTDGGDPLSELKAGSVTLKFKPGSTSNPIVNELTTKLLQEYGLCQGTGSTKLIPVERG